MQPARLMTRVFSFSLIFSSLLQFAAGAMAADRGPVAYGAPSGLEDVAIVRSSGKLPGNVVFRMTAEVVVDREARRRGLSGRESLDENRGMLFVLDEGRQGAFWMKGMRFGLDLLYFDRGRKLIKILAGLQPCGADCPAYETPDAAAYVIEITAGTAQKYRIRTGDSFTRAPVSSGGQGK